MTPSRIFGRWRGRWLPLFAALLAAPAVTCGMDEALLICDDALAHVSECCGRSFEPEYGHCHGVNTGCDGSNPPKLDQDTLKCIAALPCDRLRAGNFCVTLSVGGSDLWNRDLISGDPDGATDERTSGYSCP